MKTTQITEFFTLLKAANPNPKGELIYSSDFELLIAVILSAHTTDSSVNKATAKLFAIANTPEKMFSLGEETVKSYIKTVGLYNAKAANIIKTCSILIVKHGGLIPNTREALEELPGVGRKTANVILNVAFKQPTIFVDTHVFRVSNRTGLAPGKTPRIVENSLERFIPENFKVNASILLLCHGKYVCTAKKPACHKCCIAHLCVYKHYNSPAML